MKNKFMNDISEVKKFIQELLKNTTQYYTHGDVCSIHAIFISSNDRVPSSDRCIEFADYMITFYMDVDSDYNTDKIHRNITVSRAIPKEFIVSTFMELMSEYTHFGSLISRKDTKNISYDDISFGVGYVNISDISKICKKLNNLNGSPRNRIIFTSGATILINDKELKALVTELENLGRFDLLLGL